MKKSLSILIIFTLLFVANLTFAQTSDETILVQLNNLQIKEIKQNPEEGILATLIVTKSSSGFKCSYFPSEESEKSRPCPLKLRRNILKALGQGLKINISEETELLDINRENIDLQDLQVGNKINVYGELDKQSYEVDALIVRKIRKGKIVPAPITKSTKVFLGAIDSYTNHLIPDAIITFLETGKSFRISEQEKIKEYLKTLAAGRYNYKIQADGYTEMTDWLSVPEALQSVKLTTMKPSMSPFELTEEYLKPLHQPNMALIVGYVSDGDSYSPIEGVRVSIPGLDKSTLTNSRGFYWLNVSPMPEGGDYCKEVIDLIFSKPGYRTSKHLNVSKPTTKCGSDSLCLSYQLQLNSYLFSGSGDDVVYDHKHKLCQ